MPSERFRSKIDWTDELDKDWKIQAKMVEDNFERSKKMIEDNEDDWETYYGAYRSYFEMPTDNMTSELAVPMIFADVESYMPRIAGTTPDIAVWPRTPEDRGRAAKNRVLLKYWWDALKMNLKLVDYVKSAKIYGTSIWKVDYRKETRNRVQRVARQEPVTFAGGLLNTGETREVTEFVEGPMVTWDGPVVNLLDLDEVYFDEDGWDVDSCAWIIHKKKSNMEDIIASLESGEEIYDEKGVREIIEWSKFGNQEDKEEGVSLKDFRNSTFKDMVASVDPHKRVVTELECWYDGKVCSIIKENTKLRPIQYRMNPLGRKPFIRFTPIPLPKEFYGVSFVEVLYSLAVELNVLHSARLDNLLYAAHKMFKILRTSNINPSQLTFRPGGHIYVDDMQDIEEFGISGNNFSLYRETDEIREWAQRAGGSTDPFQGIAGDAAATATEASLLSQASSSRAGLMFKILTDGPLTELARLLIMLNEIYLTEEVQVRITGDAFSDIGFETVTPEDLINRTGIDLDFKIDVATTEPETRELRLQRSTAAFQTFGQTGMPLQHPIMERIMLDVAEGFGFEDARQLIEQGREIIAQQQAAEAEENVDVEQPAANQADLISADLGEAQGG
jgi:hypothetical protein